MVLYKSVSFLETKSVRTLSNHPVHLIDNEGLVGDVCSFKRLINIAFCILTNLKVLRVTILNIAEPIFRLPYMFIVVKTCEILAQIPSLISCPFAKYFTNSLFVQGGSE